MRMWSQSPVTNTYTVRVVDIVPNAGGPIVQRVSRQWWEVPLNVTMVPPLGSSYGKLSPDSVTYAELATENVDPAAKTAAPGVAWMEIPAPAVPTFDETK